MFQPRRLPCASCGESVDGDARDAHTCEPGRRLEYQMLAMQRRIRDFDSDFRAYLDGGRGRFETWWAAREVRRGA